MKRKCMKNYNNTIKASFLGYVVQAIVNNFVPLLFVQMQNEFSIPLAQITILITFNNEDAVRHPSHGYNSPQLAA